MLLSFVITTRNQPAFGVSIHDIWHEDRGFRKSMILNTAILAATGDAFLSMDGDFIGLDRRGGER